MPGSERERPAPSTFACVNLFGPWRGTDDFRLIETLAHRLGRGSRPRPGLRDDYGNLFCWTEDDDGNLVMHPAEAVETWAAKDARNNRPGPLLRMIEVLENAIGCRANRVNLPMQPGDVRETYADTTLIEAALGFRPSTPIEVGLPRFVEWYRAYRSG